MLLNDEIIRREQRYSEPHLRIVWFKEICRVEDFHWTAVTTLDQPMLYRDPGAFCLISTVKRMNEQVGKIVSYLFAG